MTQDNQPQLYSLSRRKMLAGLGAVGLASAGAGLGTSAYFSDEESFENNTLTAGTLDLRVRYEASYDSDGAVENMADSAMGTQDGDPAGMFYDLDDVKPGDSGHVEFCFDIVDNPAYMWACGDLSQAENGMNEPEMAVDDTPDIGELGDSIVARLSYCDEVDGAFVEGEEIVSGSLVDVIAAISSGAALDGDGVAGLVPGEQSPYDEEVVVDEEEYITGACICLFWEIPYEVGNEIQSDSLTMSFEFHALQARHNDGTTNPCAPSITTRTGEGFAKQQEFATEQETSFARGRFGDNGPSGSWEVAVGPDVGSADTANYVWTPGNTVPFSYIYDGSGNASFTLDGVNVGSGIPAPSGKLAITTKADEATVSVANLALDLDGVPVTLSGPDAISASNDGPDREVTYLVFDTDAADVANAFTISGDVTVDVQGDYSGSDEGVAFDISVE
ncbi:choice-of-anchor W domain-containing protein [Halobellus litoreus]|uniref:Choice-of-anchor W domain-containing protein n=1 Tax=Halobellus litoreus TaxID=755310 RepID=A0ABD6DSS6_9EURY|nr:choice-of-anchor W domain-containing protein [Halobellus litoreus]